MGRLLLGVRIMGKKRGRPKIYKDKSEWPSRIARKAREDRYRRERKELDERWFRKYHGCMGAVHRVVWRWVMRGVFPLRFERKVMSVVADGLRLVGKRERKRHSVCFWKRHGN